MEDSAILPFRFETTPLELEAAFDGGKLTSDGGLLWLAHIDRNLGLCEAIAEHVPEWRAERSVRHSLVRLVRQRVYQIACGYEDQNDAQTLRTDPLLKLVLGGLPETGADLASQPTLSRVWRTLRVRRTACVWPRRWANSTSESAARMVD